MFRERIIVKLSVETPLLIAPCNANASQQSVKRTAAVTAPTTSISVTCVTSWAVRAITAPTVSRNTSPMTLLAGQYTGRMKSQALSATVAERVSKNSTVCSLLAGSSGIGADMING